MKHIMDILKQSGKKKYLPVIFYVFIIGVTMNTLWLLCIYYPSFFHDFLKTIGVKGSWYLVYCFPIEWITTLFAIVYYFITKKKVYGFWLMIIFSILLVILSIYLVAYYVGYNANNVRMRTMPNFQIFIFNIILAGSICAIKNEKRNE
jgi:hypothetical protein